MPRAEQSRAEPLGDYVGKRVNLVGRRARWFHDDDCALWPLVVLAVSKLPCSLWGHVSRVFYFLPERRGNSRERQGAHLSESPMRDPQGGGLSFTRRLSEGRAPLAPSSASEVS